MLEKHVEDRFKLDVKAAGGLAEKLVLVTGRGFPDRTLILPGETCPLCERSGSVGFLELKKPGGKVSPQQKRWLRILEELGIPAAVAWTNDEAKSFIERLKR